MHDLQDVQFILLLLSSLVPDNVAGLVGNVRRSQSVSQEFSGSRNVPESELLFRNCKNELCRYRSLLP
jgi:hypothetical protein